MARGGRSVGTTWLLAWAALPYGTACHTRITREATPAPTFTAAPARGDPSAAPVASTDSARVPVQREIQNSPERAALQSAHLPVWHVVAWGKNGDDQFGSHWAFEVQQLSNRVVVTACVSPGQGCVHPRAAEVVDDRWTDGAFLTGLPTFEMVRLPKVAGATFRGMQDEHGRDLLGSRSFDGLFGEWPSNAWAKVAYLTTHSAVRYRELYHFEGNRWQLVYAPRHYGYDLGAVVPWQLGVAIVTDLRSQQSNDTWSESSLVHLQGHRSRVMLRQRRQEIWAGKSEDALVAVQITPPSDNLHTLQAGNASLWRWSSLDASSTTQALSALGVDPDLVVFNVWVSDSVTFLIQDKSGHDQSLSLTYDGLWHAAAPQPCHACEPRAGAPESVALDLPWPQSVALYQVWRTQGRRWAVTYADESRVLLLSDRPTQTVWTMPEELACPGRPNCFP